MFYISICKPITPKLLDTTNSLTSGLVFDSQLYEGSGTTTADLFLSGNGMSGSEGST